MKRIFFPVLIAVMLSHADMSAMNYLKNLEQRIVGIGKNIEDINLPIIGKFLPLAMLGASLRECPVQTVVALAALGGYMLSQNEMVQAKLSHYEIFNALGFKRSQANNFTIDETLFYFDGDDFDDALDGEIAEDELLFLDRAKSTDEDITRKRAEKS